MQRAAPAVSDRCSCRCLPHVQAVIFGYALGDGADVEHPRAMACMTDGIFYQVANATDLGDVMSSYYAYFAASQGFSETRWISYVCVRGS